MMEKKYRLTDDTIQRCGRVLYRIEALRSFIGVEIGQKGGFVESEENLSHDGNCWIGGNAMVYCNAVISEDAKVCGDAMVFGNAKVCGDAEVFGNADVFGNAKVYGDAEVFGNAKVFGNAEVYGNAMVFGDAKVTNNRGYIVFKNWWSSGRYFTWTRSNNMWKVGCFYGTGEELIAKAYKDSELSGREYERIVRYVEAINKPVKSVKGLNRIQRIVCKLFRINGC